MVEPEFRGRLIDFISIKNSADVSNQKIIYGTSHRMIAHWDTRQQADSWNIRVEIDDGLLSTLALPGEAANTTCSFNGSISTPSLPYSSNEPTWMAFGTFRGIHIIWDLRYHMQARKIQTPDNRGITSLNLLNSCGPSINGKVHTEKNNHMDGPMDGIDTNSSPIASWPKYIASSVEGTNTINFYDIQSGQLESQIIADPEKITSKEPDLPHFTSCQFFGDNSRKLITAGTDRMVRYWDLDNVSESYTVTDAPNFRAGSSNERSDKKYFVPSGVKSFDVRSFENVRTLIEAQYPSSIIQSSSEGYTNGTGKNGRIVNGDVKLNLKNNNSNSKSPDDKFIYSPLPHIDAITDMSIISCRLTSATSSDNHHWENERAPGAFEIGRNGVEGFVVTASRDGWVSVWK